VKHDAKVNTFSFYNTRKFKFTYIPKEQHK